MTAVKTLKKRHSAIRSCVVCRQTSDKRTLLRVVRLPEKDGGAVVSDPTGKKPGRGASLCPQKECLDKAQKQKRFERALSVPSERLSDALFSSLKEWGAQAAAQEQSGTEPANSLPAGGV